jgi:predicted metalloendopeptidase
MKLGSLVLSFAMAFAILVGNFSHAETGKGDPLLDLTAIDASVNPCDNFYQYACGNWLKNFSLPGDHAAYGRQSDGLTETTTRNIQQILEICGEAWRVLPELYEYGSD